MTTIIIALIVGMVATTLIMPLIIKLSKKLSLNQTILKYVEEHKSKQGTPTMGGLAFFITTIILFLIFIKSDKNCIICMFVGGGFALLGFLDDFVKVKLKRNLGLRPYQKIAGQLGISIIFAIYVYLNVGSNIMIPFFNNSVNIGLWIIPLVVMVCIATTNSVNLTDGLDGLAGSVSSIILVFTIAILCILQTNALKLGFSSEIINNYHSLSVLCAIFLGGLLGFLFFNMNKASIFMGDVGSLGIGGMLASIFIVAQIELSLIVLGICFVISSISVIVQVAYFKKTKKRVFKMAPFHHHLQMSGFSETKICYTYSLITMLVGLFLIISYL